MAELGYLQLTKNCAPHKEATELRVPRDKVEVMTSKVLRSPPWLGWPLLNICVAMTTDMFHFS
jgi:hypothetical protein